MFSQIMPSITNRHDKRWGDVSSVKLHAIPNLNIIETSKFTHEFLSTLKDQQVNLHTYILDDPSILSKPRHFTNTHSTYTHTFKPPLYPLESETLHPQTF